MIFSEILANWRFRTPVILPLVAALLVSYFAFYTFFGERSLLRLIQLDKQLASSAAELASIKSEHDGLETKVSHLRSSSIDPDLLDQQARHVLNYTAQGEIVVMTPVSATTNAVSNSANIKQN